MEHLILIFNQAIIKDKFIVRLAPWVNYVLWDYSSPVCYLIGCENKPSYIQEERFTIPNLHGLSYVIGTCSKSWESDNVSSHYESVSSELFYLKSGLPIRHHVIDNFHIILPNNYYRAITIEPSGELQGWTTPLPLLTENGWVKSPLDEFPYRRFIRLGNLAHPEKVDWKTPLLWRPLDS